MKENVKLNLGCGLNHIDGYCNVDKSGDPDIKCDLEKFPWPWEDSSVLEIRMNHILEHLGQETETFLGIVKELYRICKDQAKIHITVPHPKHKDFINDPTHVRIVTPEVMSLFSKKSTEKAVRENVANTPLATYLNVDLELLKTDYNLDPVWENKFKNEKLSYKDLMFAADTYSNVMKEISMVIKVIKPD